MSAEQIDSYLRNLEEPKRSTLQKLRRTILEIAPEAEEVISYRIPLPISLRATPEPRVLCTSPSTDPCQKRSSRN